MTRLPDMPARTAPRLTDLFFGQDSAGAVDYKYTLDQFRMGVISVKDRGAVGDGVADDTTEIQAALDAHGANGGTAFFPVGTYLVSNAGVLTHSNTSYRYCLKIPSNVIIYLHPLATIKLANSATSSIFMNDGIAGAGNSNIGIMGGGTLDMNGANQSAPASGSTAAITAHNITNFQLDNIKTKDSFDFALILRGLYQSRIVNVECLSSRGGGFLFGLDNTIETATGRMNHNFIDNLLIHDITGTTAGNDGNPFTFIGDNCHIGSVEAYNCDGNNGIKIQAGTADCHFDSLFVHDSESNGVKLQGDTGNIVRCSFGVLKADTIHKVGVHLSELHDCSIQTIISTNAGVGGAGNNIQFGNECQRINVGQIFSTDAQFSGVNVSNGTNSKDINIGQIISRNASIGDTGVQSTVNIDTDKVNVGEIIVIDDQDTETTRYGLRVGLNASDVYVGRLATTGAFTTHPLRIQEPGGDADNVIVKDIMIDGEPYFKHTSGGLDISTRLGGNHNFDSTGGAFAQTVGDGPYLGYQLRMWMSVDGGDVTVTVTNHETSSPEVFTFGDVGDYLVLEWGGTKWVTVVNFGVAV